MAVSGAAASSADVVIAGGGVAGLAAAVHLSPSCKVLLLEPEAVLAAHASGRNAAIFRPLELDATTATLARRSLQLLSEWMAAPALTKSGLLLLAADAAALRELQAHARQQAVAVELLDREAVLQHAPVLARGEVGAALWVPDGGVLDIHGITSTLARVARERGAELRTGTAVARAEVERGRLNAVVLADGSRVATRALVLAAGAWNLPLAARLGAPLPLAALRRHLVQLQPATPVAPCPVMWRVDDEAYVRPESGGVLVSPCDELPFEACDPPADPQALELLGEKLQRLAPPLSGATVRRNWACLRTFAPDRELVIGPDPRLTGLYWLTGLGGRGMGVGAAAGELLAATFGSARDGADAMARAVAPGRLLHS